MNRFDNIKDQIIRRLETGLPKNLYYHGVHHTLDVLSAAERIGQSESIEEHQLELLKIAALYHDLGFLRSAEDHENIGAAFAREELPEYGYSPEDLSIICGMILATRYPQHPQTHLEQILCDADLDYLGRDDFNTIANTLFQELVETGRLSSTLEWNRLQVSFLNGHSYFTKTAKESRDDIKKAHLQQVTQLLANS